MAKTLYEGYRIGKNGGERWIGTVNRETQSGRFTEVKPGSNGPVQSVEGKPMGGSAISNPTKVGKG